VFQNYRKRLNSQTHTRTRAHTHTHTHGKATLQEAAEEDIEACSKRSCSDKTIDERDVHLENKKAPNTHGKATLQEAPNTR